MPHEDQLKAILKVAEGEMISLHAENSSLKAEINGLFEAQKFEAEQMVQLTEQIWALEEALQDSTRERDEILSLVSNLKSGMEKISEVAQKTLAAAEEEESTRSELAVQIYDIKSIADAVGG